jgi:hypothetical protein
VEHSKEPILVSLMTIDEKQEIGANESHELLSQEERDTIIESLRKQWKEKYKHLFGRAPPGLPPFREVNHSIPLMDENKQYNYRLPKCADAFKEQFSLKLQRYVDNKWWEERAVDQAAPLLCVPKKSGTLRTVLDARKRNANTIKDVTPLPDQDLIRMDVARGKYRSKIDLTDAYEQIRVKSEDVWKTAFATIYGTFVSHVMQQGDCNAPATFQRLMTRVFIKHIGKFLHVFFDDIFVYSVSIEEHEKHLGIVFKTLEDAHLFLKEDKLLLYAKSMDCLGHIIDDNGIHADTDKMAKIRNWRVPRNVQELQRFLGLVQYIGQFMPDLSSYSGPLSALCSDTRTFYWRPLHDKCFESIKALACRTPILRPIDPKRDEPIWLICDASDTGVGMMYGQGKTWETCRPAGFSSKKFSPAQYTYRTWDRELLAIIEGLMKWEDKLLGRRMNIVTDHEALKFFKNQNRLTGRQARWMEYLERFDHTIIYVEGERNKVADCLSRYYSSDTPEDTYPESEYVNADLRLDPEGDDLPSNRVAEFRAITRSKTKIAEVIEDREREAAELDPVVEETKESVDPTPVDEESYNPTLADLLREKNETSLRSRVEGDSEVLNSIRRGYKKDKLFSKVLEKPGAFKTFECRDGLIFSLNATKDQVLCVPRTMHGRRRLTEVIIDQGHFVLGHFGAQKTIEYIRRYYWWPTINKDVDSFCKSCGICQTSKTSNKHPQGLLHSLPVPYRPWSSISMDFVGPFPQSRGKNYLWVVLCRLTSMIHLIPINVNTTATELAYLYMEHIVRLHGLPESIVSDRDSKFTAKFWRELHRLMGTKMLMSTAFHPQTDGASERAIRSVSQILRGKVRADQKDWVEKIPMTEFAINSAVSSSTGFAPFELNYGYMPSMITSVPEELVKAPKGVREFVETAMANVAAAHDAVIESRVIQTHSANKRRKEEDDLPKGSLVYLSTKNLNLPKGRARKLTPRYIGPYKIKGSFPEVSKYELDLPDSLTRRRIYPKFHVNLLRRHEANDDVRFPHRDVKTYYDFGDDEEVEWLVNEITGHRWDGDEIEFEVRWNLGDSTWEPFDHVKELVALDEYLALQGAKDWKALPKRNA